MSGSGEGLGVGRGDRDSHPRQVRRRRRDRDDGAAGIAVAGHPDRRQAHRDGALHGRHRLAAQHAAAEPVLHLDLHRPRLQQVRLAVRLVQRWKRGLHPGGRLRTGAAVARDRPVRHEVRCIPCAGRAEPRQLSAGQRLHKDSAAVHQWQHRTGDAQRLGLHGVRLFAEQCCRQHGEGQSDHESVGRRRQLRDAGEPEPAQWRHPRQVRRTLDPRHHLQRLDAHQLRSEQPADHG